MSCRSQQPSAALKKVLDLYNQNKLEQALPLLWQVARDENDADALRWLDWAEAFERKTEHGPVFSEQIAELRQSAKQDNK